MFEKVLIANRGEIAVRIIRACQGLGVRAVAVYSEADRGALHTRLADEGVLLGSAAPAESYLNVARLISYEKETGAQAIHPGYGFLAENAGFARAVLDAGLTFIGPPPEAIQSMGDKAAARDLMVAAGVPVVPGYQGADEAPALLQAAAEIGYPVMIKAAAGGGGKGMRVVWEPEDLPEELAAARREAGHAFGNDRLILEKFVHRARHIEFQILADRQGNIVHLFERECSIQRRHQKIIEETPAPHMDPGLQAEMGAAAVAATRTVGYVNAGTVEFIVDPETRAFYFLEMNTRLQVEHPITEYVIGLDLVEWQLRIAAGQPLQIKQDELTQRGHALECRIYAEDPTNNFLPTSGTLHLVVPPQGPGVRFDSGVASADSVSTFYDSLLAKLIVHAEDRAAALRRMRTALRETVMLGVTINRDFLDAVLAHPEFVAGRVTTRFLDQHFRGWAAPDTPILPEALIAAALIEFQPENETNPSSEEDPDPFR